MREPSLKRFPALVIPLLFHVAKMIGLLFIVNIGLCQIGVDLHGVSCRLRISFAFHQAERVVFIV